MRFFVVVTIALAACGPSLRNDSIEYPYTSQPATVSVERTVGPPAELPDVPSVRTPTPRESLVTADNDDVRALRSGRSVSLGVSYEERSPQESTSSVAPASRPSSDTLWSDQARSAVPIWRGRSGSVGSSSRFLLPSR